MEQSYKFPARFFVITFGWSWLLWLSLILAGSGIPGLEYDLVVELYIPVTVLALFGPAMGAVVSLETINGRGAAAKFLKTFLDLRFGFRTWLVPIAVLLISTMIAWFVPELFGMKRLSMLLTCGYSFIYSWGLNKAGNRPLAALVMHGTANSFIPFFPTLSMQPGDSQPRFWIWVSITFLVGFVFLIFLNMEGKSRYFTNHHN